MQPASACTAGMLARNASSTCSRMPGFVVMMARTWIISVSSCSSRPVARKLARTAMRRQPGEDMRHELRDALCGPEGGRSQPGRGRPVLRDAAGAVRRQCHQGGADGKWRLEPRAGRALRRQHGVFDSVQSGKAVHRAGFEAGSGACGAVAVDRRCRRVPARLPAGRDRAAGLRLCRRVANASRAFSMCRSRDLGRRDRWRNGRRWTRCCRPIPG